MKLCVITTALLLCPLAGSTPAQSRTAAHPPGTSLLSAAPRQSPEPARPGSRPAELAIPADLAGAGDLQPMAAATLSGGVPPVPSRPLPSNEGDPHALGTCACSGAPAENEPPGCGLPTDAFNGGCNYVPNVFSPITLGGSVCGTAAFDGGTRDTDWYQFTLTTTTTVVWTVHAEFPSVAILMNGVCPESDIAVSFANACEDAVATATLAPGTYYAVTVPQFAAVITCGTSDDYRATLLGVSTCGYDDGVSNGSVGLGGLGGGEQMYLHKTGGVGEFAQVSSISMVWGSAAIPGFGPPNGSAAQIRIFKDPDDDGIPDDLILLKTKAFTTAGADTDVFQTVAFDAPVNVSGVYFIAVSIVSASGVYPLGYDSNTASANRAWFVAETNASGGVLDYSNFANNDYFAENSSIGLGGLYLLRGNCQPLEGGCKYDDGIAETESAYGFAGEKLFLLRHGAVGEVAEVSAVSMSWGSVAISGFSIPNGTGVQIRIFEDPDDDGIPDDAVLLQTQGLLTQDVDTNIFHETEFIPPVVVRGVYFVGASVVAAAGQYPMGLDLTTPSGNRAWFVGQNGGVINYGNLAANTDFAEMSTIGADGVHMMRADCHPTDEITAFCAPGVGGIVTCPCGNPQVPAGATRGCNNFAGGGTGGAILAGSGAATISGDSLLMNVSAGVASNVTVLFQGTTNTPNTRTGAGVRCVGGTLKRLYKGNQAAGAIAFPNVANNFHLQSVAKGYTIVPPISLYYYAAYRNSAANGQPGCPGLTFGFNSTNALAVIWTP